MFICTFRIDNLLKCTSIISLIYNCTSHEGHVATHFRSWDQMNFKSVSFVYAGEEVGFYFTWMKFYSSFVFWPAILGILMFLFRPSSATVDTDAYLPFYSVFMALWGVLFLVVSGRKLGFDLNRLCYMTGIQKCLTDAYLYHWPIPSRNPQGVLFIMYIYSNIDQVWEMSFFVMSLYSLTGVALSMSSN